MRLNISHKFIKVEREDRIGTNTDKIIISPEVGHTVEIETHLIEAEEILIEITDQIIEVEQEIIIGMIIGETTTGKMIGVTITNKNIERTIIELTIDKIMEEITIGNRGIVIEMRVGTTLEITTGITQRKDLSEVET